MPITLPTVGTLSYTTQAGSSYTFGPLTETTGYQLRAVPDSSGRAIAHVNYQITVKTTVAATPPATADTILDQLRPILMTQGGTLIYQDRGFGTLTVNSGAVKDVTFGPHPKSLSAHHIGSRYAVEVTWTVEANVPECANAKYEKAIAEANFTVDYNIGAAGLTSRHFAGHIRIATNATGRRLNDTADLYRDQFVPEVPKHFRRVSQRYSLSEDKAKLNYDITDEELPNINVPPPGCVRVKMRHSLRTAGPRKYSIQQGDLSASYTMVRGVPPALAVDHFNRVVTDRVRNLNKKVDPNLKALNDDDRKKAKAGKVIGVIPLSTAVTEVDAYGDTEVECSLSYTVFTSPTQLFTEGLWRPMPDSNWDIWFRSMAGVMGDRGLSGMGFHADEDAIISLCLGGNPATLHKVIKPPQPAPLPPIVPVNDWPVPPPEGSWLMYVTSLRLESEDHVLRHVPLEPSTSRLRTPGKIASDALDRMAAVTKGKEKPVLQKSAASMPYLIFEGQAVRVQYEIACPQLLGAFGRKAIPANRPGIDGFEIIESPFHSLLPIRAARWRLRYMLVDEGVDVPSGVPGETPPAPPTAQGGEWEPRQGIAKMKSNR